MFTRLVIYSMMVSIIFSTSIFATSITFTFDNGQITGTSPKFYEFDVMANAGAAGTKIGDNLTYINYSNNGFGFSIVDLGTITVSKGTLIQGDVGGDPKYDFVVDNNTPARLSIAVEFLFGINSGNELPTSPTQLLHVKIEILDENETAGLSFEQSLMVNQQYESDNSTKYDPVIANDQDDSSLPVELANFNAEILKGTVVINWITESETNNLGFEIYRAPGQLAEYTMLSGYETNPGLEGHGNSNTQHEYSYTDKSVEPETTYWYKLADVDFNGVKTFHDPISVEVPKFPKIPTAFELHSNYPNPFNPTTTLRFDIPAGAELVDTKLVIYNSLGQSIKTLVRDKRSPGSYEVQWDATTDSGNSAPSGIYFVVLRTERFSQTRKIVLLK